MTKEQLKEYIECGNEIEFKYKNKCIQSHMEHSITNVLYLSVNFIKSPLTLKDLMNC